MVKDDGDDLHHGRTMNGLVSLDQGRHGDHQGSNYFMLAVDSVIVNRVSVIEGDDNDNKRADDGRGNRNQESDNQISHAYNEIPSEHGETEHREITKMPN